MNRTIRKAFFCITQLNHKKPSHLQQPVRFHQTSFLEAENNVLRPTGHRFLSAIPKRRKQHDFLYIIM